MADLSFLPRSSVLLLSILGMTLVTSGFPQPRLPILHRGSPAEPKRAEWEVLFPSISLRDWSIQMMPAPDFGAANTKGGLVGEWLEPQSDLSETVEKGWPGNWAPQGPSPSVEKRNMVVADDAAFREKSKLLTAMERQKWLNSYMQKLLVVD
ncbi:tuberoinfundibular peptide of 39 residues [Aplochiton taeniatus]